MEMLKQLSNDNVTVSSLSSVLLYGNLPFLSSHPAPPTATSTQLVSSTLLTCSPPFALLDLAT